MSWAGMWALTVAGVIAFVAGHVELGTGLVMISGYFHQTREVRPMK